MPLLERRIGLLFAVFLMLLVVAFARALYFGTIRGDALAQVATTQQVATVVVPAQRGTITDRRGSELAVSEASATIVANPRLVKAPESAAKALAPLLEMRQEAVLRALTKPGKGYVVVRRQVRAAVADRVARLQLAGITHEASERRLYPRGLLAAQVLGFVGRDDGGVAVGREGLEYARDKLLSGAAGRRRTLRDALGRTLQVQELAPARPGARLELTLDAAVQERAEAVLAKVGAKYAPKSATAVVLDPQTNEILAMANWPRVDANAPADAPPEARQNRAVAATYEPGSTFKAFTVAGALQEGEVTPDTVFDLPPTIQVADRVIGESHPRGTEALSTSQILAQSSNVGAVKVGLRLGQTRFDRWVRRFGFGRPTGVDLPGEERGIIKPVSAYSGSSMGNLPIGQGESVTTLQMAAAYSVIANGGVLRKPRLVRRVNGRRAAPPDAERIISERVSGQVRRMLEGVFAPGGTAEEVSIPGYVLAGKTGTANKVDAKTGEYSQDDYVASFVGFAPARDPRLLVSVMVDEPRGAIYGGVVAAPAFGEIAEFALSYLRIPPT